jgi:hypothetical protein
MSRRLKPGVRLGWDEQAKRHRRDRRLVSDAQADFYRHLRRGDEEEVRNFFDESENESDEDGERRPSNIFSCLLMGVNWWNFLKEIQPKIPKTINPELRKELATGDISELQERFGKRPTRGDLDEIEEFLGIDLYIMVAGEFTPLGITRRPARLKHPLGIRELFRELEKESFQRNRPVVVLQSPSNFFHELGDFYLFPAYSAALNFDAKWKNIWRLIVEKRWPELTSEREKFMKINEVKALLKLGPNEIFSIGDGVFKRLKQKFDVTVSIWTGNIINDNRNNKTMVYTTDRWRQNKAFHLNILVANYSEYEFYRAFEARANLEYGELIKNPDLRPTIIYDKQQKRCKNRAENLTDEAVNAMYNFGKSGDYNPPVYHDSLDDDDLDDCSNGDEEGPDTLSSFIVEDRTSYSRKKFSVPKVVSQFFDNDCQASKTNNPDSNSSKSSLSEDEFRANINGVDIGAMPKDDSDKWDNLSEPTPSEPAPNVQFQVVVGTNPPDENHKKRLEDFELSDSDQSIEEIEMDSASLGSINPTGFSSNLTKNKYDGQFIEADRPVLNLVGVSPNIFDNSTVVRELPEKYIRQLLCCKTPNCLYVDDKRTVMDQHEKNCSGEAKTVIKQRRYGHDICLMRKSLFKEGFLPAEDYFQTFFVTYDIETTMSKGPFCPRNGKYHNLATIAAMNSNYEKIVFHRESMDYSDGLALVVKFLNYLNAERKSMVQRIPECITQGISFYNRIMEDPETHKTYPVGVVAKFREKLRYLQDFEKLKVYAWNGERYDLPVLYPMLISMLYEFSARDCSKIKIIKRGNGYMLIECNNISFRDFMNYAQRMSLDKLARSCGLDAEKYSKGCWPYEHFSSIDQIIASKDFTQYTAYRSTMHFKSPKYAQEMNDMIYEKTVKQGIWSVKGFENYIIDLLNLEVIQFDPVIKLALENNELQEMDDDELPIMDSFDYMVHTMLKLRKLFTFDFTKGCHQCDPESPAAMDFFRFSPKQYETGRIMWIDMKNSFKKSDPDLEMDMMRFLYEYNLNDCYLLTGSIIAIAKKYAEKFRVGLHNDLSISKIAERIAFMEYDDTAPPIYSIPSTQPQFYDDCRKNLMGGIVQVLHRAVNLNGPQDYIPKAASIAPNGRPYKSVVVYDFTSLYPFIASGDTTTGPGIIYRPKEVSTAPGGQLFKETRFFGSGMFKGKENSSLESVRWLEWLNCRLPTPREPNPYYQRVLHAYNYKEFQFGNYFIDGTVIHQNTFIDEDQKIKKKTYFEYRGCYWHPCPHCKKKPLGGMKVREKIDGKWMDKIYSRQDLIEKDEKGFAKLLI